jgi:hypothetical protein
MSPPPGGLGGRGESESGGGAERCAVAFGRCHPWARLAIAEAEFSLSVKAWFACWSERPWLRNPDYLAIKFFGREE